MAEVIYTRESTRNTINESRNTRDESIEEFMKEIITRPLFRSPSLPRDNIYQKYSNCVHASAEVEVVGSNMDGTQIKMALDNGDIDSLIFSPRLTFDVDDELLFEYRDDPHFLRIPQPKQLENKTSIIDGLYMSAHDLRFFTGPLFGEEKRNNVIFPYDLFPREKVTSLHKCATTCSHSYSYGEKSGAYPREGIDPDKNALWDREHILLTYMMRLKNENEIQFVRELLFDDLKGDFESVKEILKSGLSDWQVEMQWAMLGNLDLIYFNGDDFRKRWESVCQEGETQFGSAMKIGSLGECSIDYVPAIKCSGWPRPAMDWMDRPRQWPDENVVEDIVSSGFQLVAKSPPINPTPEKDFILSFSPSEIKLIQALPNSAKNSYRLLKFCYKAIKGDICDGPTLKSFHLKSALFWVAERTPPEMWESKGILWGIRSIINFLLSKLEQGHLPAFFIPESNLIPHFRVHDIKRLSGILRSIHENPACYIKLWIEKNMDFVRNILSRDDINDLNFVLSWRDLINVAVYCADGFPIDRMFANNAQVQTETFSGQFMNCLLDFDEGSSTVKLDITDSQLKYVDLFAKTVSMFKMDLFNVLDQEIDSSLLDLPVDWINDLILKLHPSYNTEEDKQWGESIYTTIKLRLKYYGNMFHTLCCKLLLSLDNPGMCTGNQDFNYILMFLKKLKQMYRYSDETIENLLHNLLYFCHFTRVRHHSLPIVKQILRSIREFFQMAQCLMTVYFNPNALYPKPVVCLNISLLEELNT